MQIIAAGLPSGGRHLPFAEEYLTALFAVIALLLFGMLLHVRRLRRKVEQENKCLQQSESHLRLLDDNLQGIVHFQLIHNTANDHFEFTFISRNVYHVLGLDQVRISSDARLVLDQIYETDIPVLQTAYVRARERLDELNVEIRALDINGSPKWLQIRALPQHAADRLVWDGIIQDISAAKEAEQTMLDESRNFQNLFETIEDFLIICDMDGLLLHANPSAERRLKYSQEELEEMSIFELYPDEIRPEIYQIIASLRTNPAATCTHPIRMKSGSTISVEMHLFQGIWKHRNAIFGVARDVVRHHQTETALRESKRMLQLIIDTIPMSIFWKDKDSIYLGCNQAFIGECRLARLEDVVGKNPFDLFDELLAPEIVERDQEVMRTNEALFNQSESHTRPDGSIGWREISLIPLRNDAGKAVGVLGVTRDVTEQNRAEERLKRTLDDMERFNQLMRGRERRTLELKAEINDLLSELGKPKKYRTTSDDML